MDVFLDHVEGIPFVESLSKQHHGEKVSLKNGRILIGRDPSSEVCFHDGTPGVSARHCVLSYDDRKEEFLLEDLDSTYGTFLTNGDKLEPHVPYSLQTGESFYVGQRANLFQVCMDSGNGAAGLEA